jgi:uncharacterized protein YdhG (YjbR/CyaY superfamily)
MNEKVNAYISAYPAAVKESLILLRQTVLSVDPSITEGFSYQMPAYSSGKPLVYFAAYKKHIGFYPTGTGISAFEDEFISLGLIYSKGAVQFPLGTELPLQLIKKIVEFKLSESN